MFKYYQRGVYMNKKIFTLLFLASVLSSCSTTFNKNQSSGALDIQLKSNLNADVEVDMSKKIQGAASATKLFSFITLSGPNQYADGVVYGTEGSGSGFSFFGPGVAEEVKSAAVSNAVTAAKAELIIAPQYILKTKSVLFGLYKEVSVQVSGYAGRVKTIKSTN
jgi:hypothetical protein